MIANELKPFAMSLNSKEEEIDANKGPSIKENPNPQLCDEFEGVTSGDIKKKRERKITKIGKEFKRDLLDTK